MSDPERTIQNHPGDKIALAVMILALALFALANLMGVETLWGLNFLKYFSPLWTYLALGLSLSLAVPTVSRSLCRALMTVSEKANSRVWGGLVVVGFSGALLATLAYVFNSATPFLGDGALRLNAIVSGEKYLWTEFLDLLSHAVFYEEILKPGAYPAQLSYRIINPLLGVIFVMGAYRLARYLSASHTISLFLVLLSSGALAQFAGYVEHYALLLALLPHIYLSGLKVADGLGSRWSFVGWYVLGAASHVVGALLFAPALLLTLLGDSHSSERAQIRASRFLWSVLAFAIATAYVLRYSELIDLKLYLLGFFPVEFYQQGIFTVNHALNLLNWILLAGLPAVVLSAVAFFANREAKATRSDNHPATIRGSEFQLRRRYVLWIIVPALVFVFFFNPQIGGPRDWDLFSLPIYLLIPASLTYLFIFPYRPAPHLVAPLIVVSFASLAGFVSVNHSVSKSTDRFIEISEVAKFKNLYHSYTMLYNYASSLPEIHHRQEEFAQKAWEQPPYTRPDSLWILGVLGRHHLANGLPEKTWERLQSIFALDSANLAGHDLLREFYSRYGSREDLLVVAQMYVTRFPGSAIGQMNAGTLYFLLGEADKGEKALGRAFELDSSDVNVLLNFAQLKYWQDEDTRAIELFERVIEKTPRNFQANYHLASVLLDQGRIDQARQYLKMAEQSAGADDELDDLKKLREKAGL